MTKEILFEQIKLKKSFLCVGLDSDISKIPSYLLKCKDPVFEFNKAIVNSTHKYSIAYKPNTAFYESLGSKGWRTLEKTVDYIKSNYPEIFLIADAKRGDIGNTSRMYAKAYFETMNFDAVTVAPYMGEDSITPFLSFNNKFVILLALTSNKGAYDFQFMKNSATNELLYEKILKDSQKWGNADNLMYVTGATKSEKLEEIRKIIKDNFLLVPGIGAQGGNLEQTIKYGQNKYGGLIINSSRGIIFADNSENFAEKASLKAQELQKDMSSFL